MSLILVISNGFIILYIGNDLCISILPIRVQSGLDDVSDQDTPYQSKSSKLSDVILNDMFLEYTLSGNVVTLLNV